jgi:prevent-host-death family protein
MEAARDAPRAEVKSRLSEVVDRVQREHGPVVVRKHGRPAAVMITVDDLESLDRTLEILSHGEVLAEIRVAEADVEQGRTSRVTKEEATELIKNR